MARTKQTARKSTGGMAPRKQLATCATRDLRRFMTSQQNTGTAVRNGAVSTQPSSYMNAENVLGSFKFGAHPSTREVFEPHMSLRTTANPQTGLDEHWLGVQWASKLDGPGMAEHGRPPLAVVLALDISGSMTMTLEGDDEGGPIMSKLDVSKLCVRSILGQLTAADSLGITLFNHETQVLQPLAKCTPRLKATVLHKLDSVRPGGGTRLEAGFSAGMASLAEGAGETHMLKRVYFLTDMLSGPGDEVAVLDLATKRATDEGLHTTVIGVGVDLSVGTVERLSGMPAGKYLSVMNAHEFERTVGAEFAHDVVPIAFNIKLALGDGYAFERACGLAELNAMTPGVTELTVSSEFATPLDDKGEAAGGVLLFKLRSPRAADAAAPRATRATRHSRGSGSETVSVKITWNDLQGVPATVQQSVPVGDPTAPMSAALRKGIALVRFVDLQNTFCEAEDGGELQPRLERLAGYRAGRTTLLEEMEAVGDTTLQCVNASFLQTLDQIIEMETRETAAQQAVEEKEEATARTRKGKRTRSSGSRAHASKILKEGEEAEFLCPILKTRMTDPVCTVDGHTFERSAIEQWFLTHTTSPLTGLRLVTKSLTPNHVLRSMLQHAIP